MAERGRHRELLRFAVVGVVNTGLTYLAFVVLAGPLGPARAYVLVYMAGIAFSATVTGAFVFGAGRNRTRSVVYAGWYAGVLVLGLVVLALVHRLGVREPAVSGLLVLAVTTPVNFIGARTIFTTALERSVTTRMPQ